MAGYTAYIESAAAVAIDTGFAWLMAVANTGLTLNWVSIGVKNSTATAPTDFTAIVGINLVTTAGTTPTNGPNIKRRDSTTAAAQGLWISAFATPPTTSTNDGIRIPLNTKSTVVIPLGWRIRNVTTEGFAFINRNYALPANHAYVIGVDWDE